MSLVTTRDIARSAYNARSPNLWNGLIGAWCPSVGLRSLPNVIDYSLYRVPAVANGAMTDTDFVPGRNALALDFDGTNDYLEIADRDDLSPNTSFTVAAWIRFNSITSGTSQAIVSKDNNAGAGTREFQLLYSSVPTAFRFSVCVAGGTTFATADLTALGVPVAGTWYFLVGRKNVDDGTISVWANGRKATTSTTNAPTGASPVRIGRLGGASPVYFNGRMQDTFIWRRHLTDSELLDMYGGAHPLDKKLSMRVGFVPGGAITLTASPAIATWTVNNGAISLGSDVVISASAAIANWTVNDGVMDVAGSIALTASPATATWFALDGVISVPSGPITLTAAPAIFTWTALSGTIPGGPITLTTTSAVSMWVANDVTLVFLPCYALESCPLSSTRFTLSTAPPR